MRTTLGISLLLAAFASAPPAHAQSQPCQVPNTITNGQVADASEVMENFNALAACADEKVSHEGAPNSGEIAVFDGNEGITSGNLTGDVTTAGSTETTLSATGVVPGSYTNATVTVDAKGRVTFADSGAVGGTGGGAVATKYDVITPGDNFIDVKLDSDGGNIYRVVVKGEPSADARLYFRVSSDNGQTFFDGATDYKSYDQGGTSVIDITSRRTVQSGRNTIIDFTLAGMNDPAGDRIALTGTIFTVTTNISNVLRLVGGHDNGIGAGDFNAFRVFSNAGTMDGFSIYVERVY